MENRRTVQESSFACNMTTFTPAERNEHIAVIEQVFGAVEEIQELSDGYAFRLANETTMLLKLADFIAKERLCCPFFGFSLELEPEGGALWLSLTGREGVKPFIQAEIGHSLSARHLVMRHGLAEP
jgi:hypothetical protein